MRVLVVDDNSNSLQSLCLVLHDLGHEAVGLEDSRKAMELLQKKNFSLVITDIRMPGVDGLELLTQIKAHPTLHSKDVVLITGHGDMTTAVDALRKGAYDYLNKPINARELAAVVERVAERQNLLKENVELKENLEVVDQAAGKLQLDLDRAKTRLRELHGIGQVITASKEMQALLAEAAILHGDPTVPVLIEGETGTGKEIFAKYIHYGEGGGVNEPFIAINCSAIPHELFESELFGHVAGAFTGSRAEGAPGKLEQAGSGTLFLDEVAEMPLSLQPKLLRVLEERDFYRVGGGKKLDFKARIVCAGNRDMHEMVEKGLFRRDLYHRLRVGHIAIPPLRMRKADIEPLASAFLAREARRKKKSFTRIAPETLAIFASCPWPGNVRELENTIERAVLMHNGESLLPEHVHFVYSRPATAPQTDGVAPQSAAYPATTAILSGAALQGVNLSPDVALPEDPFSLDDLELHIIEAAVAKFDGNKTKAATFLGMSRFALHRRLQAKG